MTMALIQTLQCSGKSHFTWVVLHLSAYQPSAFPVSGTVEPRHGAGSEGDQLSCISYDLPDR